MGEGVRGGRGGGGEEHKEHNAFSLSFSPIISRNLSQINIFRSHPNKVKDRRRSREVPGRRVLNEGRRGSEAGVVVRSREDGVDLLRSCEGDRSPKASAASLCGGRRGRGTLCDSEGASIDSMLLPWPVINDYAVKRAQG